jgi:superfamily II RNA helicase
MVFAALAFEGKKRTWFSDRFAADSAALERVVQRRVRNLRKAEAACGIEELVKEPDFAVAGAVAAWCRGMRLADVCQLTSLPPGDLVRVLRLTVMVLRQVRYAARGHDAFIERIQRSIIAIKRDEADAEAQLRVE